MCNQCNDIRMIHNQKKVFGVFHNSKFVLPQATRLNAERSINIMKGTWCSCTANDECVWEIYEIERKDIIWDGR